MHGALAMNHSYRPFKSKWTSGEKKAKPKADIIPELMGCPAVQKASEVLNAADEALEAALARGLYWENTPSPQDSRRERPTSGNDESSCLRLEGSKTSKTLPVARPKSRRGKTSMARTRKSVTIEDAPVEEAAAEPVLPSKFGRKRKPDADRGPAGEMPSDEAVVTMPPKKRGRKRKADADANAHAAGEAESSEPVHVETTKPRGRGRPRKAPVLTDVGQGPVGEAVQGNSPSPPASSKRGRKMKVEELADTAAGEEESTSVPAEEPEPKRRRSPRNIS